MNSPLSTSKWERIGPRQRTPRFLWAFSIGVLSFGGAVGISSSNASLSLALCAIYLLIGNLAGFGRAWGALALAPALPLAGAPWPAAAITASAVATLLLRRQLSAEAEAGGTAPWSPHRGRADFRNHSIAAVVAVFGAAGWFIASARFAQDPFVMERPAPSALLIGTCVVALAVFNAAGEELLWRHHLHEVAAKVGLPTIASTGIISCSFGIAHLQGVPSGYLGVLGAGCFGMALGLLRIRYGFVAAVLAHFFVDVAVFSAIASNTIFTG